MESNRIHVLTVRIKVRCGYTSLSGLLMVRVVFFVSLYFAKLCVRHVSQVERLAGVIFALRRLLLKFLLNVAATGQRATAIDWPR